MLTTLAAALVGGYVLTCAAARAVYPRMLFPAPRLVAAPAIGAAAKLLSLPQAKGGATGALFWAPPEGAGVAVIFHGNGETMFDEAYLAEAAVARGLGAMVVEYRGYGLTHGAPPDEEAMYEDAEAALAFLAQRGIGPDRVTLWGNSLGTGVAAEMARRGKASKLVLVAPFTSTVAMGRRFAPFLPMSVLMSHRFDTLAKGPAIRAKTLVVHGDADELIPVAMGEAVAAAIPGARFVRVAGGHHNDLYASPRILDTVLEHVSGG